MAQYKTSSLGYKLTFNGPGTVEEYDQLAGRPNACLEDAVDNEIFRGTLPEWADPFVAALEKLTGIKRNVDADATEKAKNAAKSDEARAKVKDVLEKPKAFNNRVKALVEKGEVPHSETGTPLTVADLQALAQATADSISINPAPSRRQGAPKKDLLEKADNLLAGDADVLESKISVYQTAVDFDLVRGDDGRPTRESLARLIGLYLDYLLDQA